MRYLPRHADPADLSDEEWDGTDPMTALEDRIEAQYAARDAKHLTQAATSRQNRKDLRDSIPQVRRQHMANKGYPMGYRTAWEIDASYVNFTGTAK